MMRWMAALALVARGHEDSNEAAKAKPVANGPKLPWSDDHAVAIAKLQGSWLVKSFGVAGAVAAWRFEGDKVTKYDPTTVETTCTRTATTFTSKQNGRDFDNTLKVIDDHTLLDDQLAGEKATKLADRAAAKAAADEAAKPH